MLKMNSSGNALVTQPEIENLDQWTGGSIDKRSNGLGEQLTKVAMNKRNHILEYELF